MYPVPTSPPRYEPSPKISGINYSRSRLGRLSEQLFFLAAILLAFGLSWYLVVSVREWGWWAFGTIALAWLVGTYLALPRLHQLLTDIYVPDYFIARTRTGDGLLGDPINLAVQGTENEIHHAMLSAGWTRADPLTFGSALRIVRSALFRRSYPEAPVSSLFVFGRQQDFAYQQEVRGSASRRHHVRFWRTPDDWLLPGGHRVDWVAAGTYDRSVGLSLFTGQVTHKIDANIDVERDYIIDSLRYADPRVGVDVIRDFSTGYHSRNGGGDRVRTDGNLPILDVTPLSPDSPAVTEPDEHGLGARPVSLILGIALIVSLVPLDLIDLLRFQNWGEIGEDLVSKDVVMPLVYTTAVAGYLAHLVLAALTYLRVLWARVVLLGLTIGASAVDLIAMISSRSELPPTMALLQVLLTTGGVFCLTSRSARRWTESKTRSHVFEKRRRPPELPPGAAVAN